MAYDGSTAPPFGVEGHARAFITDLVHGDADLDTLSRTEWQEAIQLCAAIQRYSAVNSNALFLHRVPGCGVVDAATADIISGSELIEVKAVTRAFRALDFRQTLTYAAMYYASGFEVTRITLLNPRRGRFFSESLDLVASDSSGHGRVELMQHLISWMLGLQVSA
ncbi:hypothetical protein [Herbidospora sp. RD11066]